MVQSYQRFRTVGSTQQAHTYDTTGLLSCILKQLYQFLPGDLDVPELRQACFEIGDDQPSREAITKGIKNIGAMFSQSFIVVDGLDECSGVSSLEFETFCNFLASITRASISGSATNVIIFSRPGYTAIINATNGFPSIEVDNETNKADISRFIEDRSKQHLTRDSASLKEIKNHLLNSADGMFLWVSLVIDSIKQERTAKKMKDGARSMPRGLYGLYADAMKRIIAAEPSVKELALKALLWIANSKKPLSKAQLLEVLAIEEGMTSLDEDERLDDDIPLTKDCADLIVLKEGKYLLVHPSLGDFLRGLCDDSVEGLEVYQELQFNAPQILGADCLMYLKFDAFTSGPLPTEASMKETLNCYPFLEYAAVFWGDHVREALERNGSSLEDSTRELLEPQKRRDLIHQVYMRFYRRNSGQISSFPFPSETPSLHILSIFGLYHLLSRYRVTELDTNQALGAFEAIARLGEKLRIENDPTGSRSLRDLGVAHLNSSQTKEAFAVLETVLKAYQKHGAGHIDLFAGQHDLFSAYLDAGRIREAAETLKRMVRMGKSALNENQVEFLSAQRDHGNASLILERVAEIIGVPVVNRDEIDSSGDPVRAYIEASRALLEPEHDVPDNVSSDSNSSSVSGAQSVFSWAETEGDTASSASSLDLSLKISNTVVMVLHKDEELKQLFKKTPSRTARDKFERNFRRLFLSFLKDLSVEIGAPEKPAYKVVIYRVRRASRNIASAMTNHIFDSQDRGSRWKDLDQSLELKEILMQKFLSAQK